MYQYLYLRRIPEKIRNEKSLPEYVKDKFGQQYAGIYVGDCEVPEDHESRRNTLSFPTESTSRRTSQSCLGIFISLIYFKMETKCNFFFHIFCYKYFTYIICF